MKTIVMIVALFIAGCGDNLARPAIECKPLTCADVGAECGIIDDGCGHPVTCPRCTGLDDCQEGNICEQTKCGSTVCDERETCVQWGRGDQRCLYLPEPEKYKDCGGPEQPCCAANPADISRDTWCHPGYVCQVPGFDSLHPVCRR